MSEEENKVLEYFKNNQVFDMELVFNYIPILLNIIEGLSTKVDIGIEIIKELKEKNKKLENADLTTVYMSGFYDGEKKWRDKIKKFINEETKEGTYNFKTISVKRLKELLEEE